MMKRWRQRQWQRQSTRAQRESRNLLPKSWKKRWYLWVAGAPSRLDRRREFYRLFVPTPVRKWWSAQSPPKRSRVRRALLGLPIIIAITFAVVSYNPTTSVRGARYARFVPPKAEFSAYENLTRVPSLGIAEFTMREEGLRRVNVLPVRPPSENCSRKAFQTALSSDYARNSIASSICAGYYGIGNIRKTGKAAAASIGFFAVDRSGRWRLVGTVPNDDNLEKTLPDGFPVSLLKRWAQR
jgi:hypothetical protein